MMLQLTATDTVCSITIISYQRSRIDYDHRIMCVFTNIEYYNYTSLSTYQGPEERSQAQSNFLFVRSSFQLITRWQHTLVLVLINRALMKNLDRLFANPIYKN